MILKFHGCKVEVEPVSSARRASSHIVLTVTDEFGKQGRVVLTALRARNIAGSLAHAAAAIECGSSPDGNGPRSW